MPQFHSPGDLTYELRELCGGDKNAAIKFVWKVLEPEHEIHSVTTSVAELENGKTSFHAGENCTLEINFFHLV